MTQVSRAAVVPRAARFERPRPRLLGRLAEAVEACMVVLVAPSGYGKTTLLAQYARSTPRRVVWCRINGAHEGAGDVVSRLASQLPELRDLQDLDARTPDEVLVRRLTDALAALEEDVDLIIDNVSDDRLARWLGSVADRLEEGHRLLLSSHSTDGLRLAHRLAEGRVLLLDTDDLAFDEEETQAYLEGRGGDLNPEQLRSLAGWPAGLALSAHGAHRHAEVDDLVLEALQNLPPNLLTGLPPLAPLELWSESGAQPFSPSLPPDWLKIILRAGLPLSPLGGGVYRPHDLLVRVLDRLLQRDPELARTSRALAARVTEAAGSLERASQLYRQAGELNEAVRLADVLVPRYRDRGEHRLTRALLEPLVEAPLPPALQERLAWAQIETGSSREGEFRLQSLREEDRLTPAGFASLATMRGRQGNYEEQLALAQEGLARVGQGPEVPALSWPLVFASLRLGLLDQAEEIAGRFVTLAAQGKDQVRLAEAWQLQGIVWRHTRSAADATGPLIRARRVYEALGWSGRVADLHLDELELSMKNGEIGGMSSRLRALETEVGAERAVYHARRLRLLGAAERRFGRADQAEVTLQLALEATRASGLNLEPSGLPLEWADCLLQQQRPDEAATWLSMPCPVALSTRHAVLMALMTGSPLRLEQDSLLQESDAETRLRAILLLAAQGKFGAVGAAQAELDRNLHTPHLQADYALARLLHKTPANALLKSASKTREPKALEIDASPMILKLVTLGDLQVLLDGKSVQIGLTKARELLVWLAIHGSGSRDELVTALWDGSAEERHIEYFRVAVRRLRAALKDFLTTDLDPLPYAAGRYRLSPTLQLKVDVLSDVNAGWARPFLPGLDSEWIQDYRAQAFQKAVSALLTQAVTAAPDHAANLYRQLLVIDPLLALAHEGLVRALLTSGNQDGARLALNVYEQMLSCEYALLLPPAFLESLPVKLTR